MEHTREARRDAWPWDRNSLRPRPSWDSGQTRHLRVTVSIRKPHKKGHTVRLILSQTQRGGVSTLETKSSLESPRIFNTNTLPISERERFFQLDTHLSSLKSLGSQLSHSTSIVPKKIPRIFTFFTQERPNGSLGLSFQAPNHRASILDPFSLAPEQIPC